MFFGKKQEITHAETTVCARAKINLTLDVTGRRADGYHTVRMVMQSVALHDEVRVVVTQGEKKPRGIILTCNLPYLPVDERNLAFRAAELFYKETGVLMGTCEIHIEKRIPIAAGLAGGSSDAAAVLRALAALHATGLTDDELCSIGLKLGADVPYCLRGGTMLAEGIGEALTPLPPMPDCWAVLCKPGFSVSTAAVYAQMNGGDLPERPDTAGVLRALQAGDYAGVCHRLYNVMERVTARTHAEIGQIKDVLLACGADGAAMSGSGPTTFGLFRSEDKARKAYAALRRDFPDTHLTRMQPGWGR